MTTNQPPQDAASTLRGRGEPPQPQPEGRRLIFLGGLHRSGTSLVHRCLADHSRISGFENTGVFEDEGQHLQSVYRPAAAFGGPGLFGFVAEARMDERSPLATEANARRLLAEWLPYWDTSRELLIEKSPPNLIRTRFLQALFPGSRFIIVLRHPVAVTMATKKWTPRGVSTATLLEHWLACHEQFEADRALLENVHVLRYEDFVDGPQESLDAMHAFLGLPSEPLRRDVRKGVNDGYMAVWGERQRGFLTRWSTRRAIRNLEHRVRPFGYSLTDVV